MAASLATARGHVCVRERHDEAGAVDNELVAVPTDGSLTVPTVATGADFYAAPRLSADGSRLAWLQWNHPDMPWDGTELWVASFADGAIADARRVAGGRDESIVQPEWAPDGSLYFCSDRNDWWNLYRLDAESNVEPVVVGPFEIAMPPWGFGQSRYVILDDGRIAYVRGEPTGDALVVDGHDIASAHDLTAIAALSTRGSDIVLVGASYATEPAVYRLAESRLVLVHASRELGLDDAFLPAPVPVDFASGDARAHALYYAPASARYVGAQAEKPPLIVMAHGGPTGAARTQLNLGLRYWTSRGSRLSTSTTEAAPATGGVTATRSTARGASPMSTTASRQCITSSRAAWSMPRALQSAAAARVASRCWRRSHFIRANSGPGRVTMASRTSKPWRKKRISSSRATSIA